MIPRDPTWDEVIQDLGELVAAMRPFLDQAVLCGGWAAYLYRYLPGVSVASAPLLTKDFAYLFETAVCTRRTRASLKDRVAEIEGSSKLHGT